MEGVLELCGDLPVREVVAGEELITQGGHGGLLFVLIEGVLAIEAGGVLVKRISDEGAIVGEISVLLGIPQTARVVAVERSRVHVLPAGELAADPAFLLAVAKLLAARVHGMTSYLMDLRRQYGDQETHLGLMAEVLSELTSVRPAALAPGSERGDVYDGC